MRFEIYCDESGAEALFDPQAHDYASIGGIWMPSDFRNTFKESIHEIKASHGINGEFKWNKVSPNRIRFYNELVDYFFSTESLRFRIIVLDTSKINNYKFHLGDSELGFYKFYYQLLHHWILDFNQYDIFLDHKVNRDRNRLNELNRVLNNANLTSMISRVQGLPSEQSLGIQLADLLTGLVSAKYNRKTTSAAKRTLIERIEQVHLNRTVGPTPRSENKFNVFEIDLRGGW